MNILIITFEFPPMNGGAGNYCLNLASSLIKYDHRVTVLTVSRKNKKIEESIIDRKYSNLNIIRSNLNYHFWPLWGKYFITNHLARNEYEMVIIGNYTSFLSAMKIRKSCYKTAILLYTLHGNDIDYLFTKEKVREKLMVTSKKLNKMLFRIDKIICVSQYLADQANNYGIKNVKVIHHGIDLNVFKPIKASYKEVLKNDILKKYNLYNKKEILVTASRLDREKGHDVLIKSFQKTKKKLRNPILFIAGDGPEKNNLVKLTSDLGLADSIIFTGNIIREDLIKIYQIADVFIMLSLRETFGLVFIEAMACGLPVIGGNNGAIHEIIENNKNGIIVNPLDELSCMTSIIKILSNHQFKKRLINNGLEIVRHKFSSDIMAINTLQAIN